MNAPIPLIEFELDGRTLAASPGETLLQVARREGIAIPHLCYKDGFAQVGNCRACMERSPANARWPPHAAARRPPA